jgi:hypothetical protein
MIAVRSNVLTAAQLPPPAFSMNGGNDVHKSCYELLSAVCRPCKFGKLIQRVKPAVSTAAQVCQESANPCQRAVYEKTGQPHINWWPQGLQTRTLAKSNVCGSSTRLQGIL